MASPNSSHDRIFASTTVLTTARLANLYRSAASGDPQTSHNLTGITATTRTSSLAATARNSHLDNGGAEHDPFTLNVPYRPRNTIKTLSEVGVEDQSDRFLHQAFLTDPH
ncbi:hypothetical protein D4764_19G0003360 [Takifugu flavidus]|uniref:Uncharacterized protein n=1 Tax=Takifugu flavidus TaxID=433684 RepID=A0A5C6NPD9_9TELE|nr:hypothetical protein D4764_19G0003360 [Takifugu flavidus]